MWFLWTPLNAVQRAWAGVAGVVVFLVCLQVLPLTGAVDPKHTPPLSEVISALVSRLATPQFWEALLNTLTTWGIGLGISVAIGVVAGLLIGGIPVVREFTASTIEFLRPIPSVAFIPLAVLLYGTGRDATLLLIIYAAVWQMLIQVSYGAQDVDPVARDTARSYRFPKGFTLINVVVPTVLPYAVTGFRLSASVALILAITGELIIGTPGLGKLIVIAQESGAVASMYALVLVTGFLGLAVNVIVRMMERRVLHWHASVRREGMK
ncbi:ABC transporter permease [Cryobacterium flavum]|uniref:ABC transporter permease n=1 Tax=Cryobacterium flavum TaxID=1424659 RepID=A0ABY2I386_9MICO|nr:ABC transporter permease [Cryobacterium flavum]